MKPDELAPGDLVFFTRPSAGRVARRHRHRRRPVRARAELDRRRARRAPQLDLLVAAVPRRPPASRGAERTAPQRTPHAGGGSRAHPPQNQLLPPQQPRASDAPGFSSRGLTIAAGEQRRLRRDRASPPADESTRAPPLRRRRCRRPTRSRSGTARGCASSSARPRAAAR